MDILHINKRLANIDSKTLFEDAPRLVAQVPEQAKRDLESVERSISCDGLQLVLIDQMKINTPGGFVAAIEKEQYSNFIRSLSLIMALDNLISPQAARKEQARIAAILFPEGKSANAASLADRLPSAAWSHLKEAYQLAWAIEPLRQELAGALKTLKVTQTAQLSFEFFRNLWNAKRVNRLEYYLSALERFVNTADLLPRAEDELPSVFTNALNRIRQQIRTISEEVNRQLDEANRRFQEMVAKRYPYWVSTEGEVCLTSQFLRRCLKPYWDPEKEKAVVFIFDGMRYDIWHELLWPVFEERMEIIDDLPAISLLPSETHITRKAISAGAFPDAFDSRLSEDRLLKEGLGRVFGYSGEVKVISPEGAGTGEVVRYRAGNLDVYIFELCDKELHKIEMKTLQGGRQAPSRPLSFVYQQHIKNIIDTEVMGVFRGLASDTKVFITADHGFGRAGREPLWFQDMDLNERQDCSYTNCLLKVPLEQADAPSKVRDNVIAFTPKQLRFPEEEVIASSKKGEVYHKHFKAIVFPKVGFCFSRQGSPFNPDAYIHGGISLQELIVPMVVLRVKSADRGLIKLELAMGQMEAVEGQEVELRMRLTRLDKANPQVDEVRVEIEIKYNIEGEKSRLPRQVVMVPTEGADLPRHFLPDTSEATGEERRQGLMARTITITAFYHEEGRLVRKSVILPLKVRLNLEKVIRRVPPHLGNILGLTPKSMK